MIVLTATELSRFMVCNGSRLMEGSVPTIDIDSDAKKEGVAADWVVGQIHSELFTSQQLIGQKALNGVFITDEMIEHLGEYLKAVKTKSSGTLIEHTCVLNGENWQVNGRGDLIKYDSKKQHLTICDLKYGYHIVEPKLNWTLISHAVAFAAKNRLPVKKLTLTIYQPRPYHASGKVRSHNYNAIEFGTFYHKINDTLSNPSDRLCTSIHCYKCPHIAGCPAARKADANAIEAASSVFVDKIDNQKLSFQLHFIKSAIKQLKQSLEAYEELAKHRLTEGQIIQKYALKIDLANTSWQDYVTADMIEMLSGIKVTKETLLSPNQAKNKGVNADVVASLTERKTKGAKLVRIEVDTLAKQLFN